MKSRGVNKIVGWDCQTLIVSSRDMDEVIDS